MADYESRRGNTTFKGLSTTVAIFAVVGGICLIGFETMRQLRRLPRVAFVPFWKRSEKARQKDDSIPPEKMTSEDWEMGHLYLARIFHAVTPTAPMARWPFAWALQALKLDDWFYASHTGMDTVVYVRFLRGCVYWILLQTLTTAPILLGVHLTFARGASKADMNSASLSYLVVECDPSQKDTDLITCNRITNDKGRRLLWIHLCLLWFMALSWFYTLWWIARGSLRVRARWIQELRSRRHRGDEAKKEQADTLVNRSQPDANDVLQYAHNMKSDSQGDDSLGWRQRTLLVTNLPPTMRDEASVRRYFEEFLRPDDGTPTSSTDDLHTQKTTESSVERDSGSKGSTMPRGQGQSLDMAHTLMAVNDGSGDTPYTPWEEANTTQGRYVNRARNGPEPDRRPHRFLRSPVQTVVLVRKMNELSAMLSRRQEVLGQLEAAHIKLAKNVLAKVAQQAGKAHKEKKSNKRDAAWWRFRRRSKNRETEETKESDNEAAVQLREDTLKLNELTVRLSKYATFDADTQWPGKRESRGEEAQDSVWAALADVPRELLDPYQPVTRLSSLFRGQKVPTIDYLLTKLNLLTALVTEMRARPPTSYEPTSTAFVTFRDPRQARMVWRELKSQIVVKVRLAPEVKDLDWERLMRTSFTGDIVRGIGVNTFFWIATILWVIPVSLLCTSLFSVAKLEGLFPSVARFFKNNPNFEGFVGNTLPSLIVSLLTMCVPELIFQISKRAQGFVTFSALYDECLCRYWKFVICNVLIFFCVGSTTVESIILQAGRDSSILDSIAFAFPTAAPFYIAYLILGLALHTGFELLGFMVPLIQHLGARNASTPRLRALKTLPRNFNRYYWLPFHVLILTITFVFALLNPLVIPFALVYLCVALVVFKKNLAYTYFRRFNEMEGVVYFIRILRFSLDGLLVGQIVLLIFFSVTKQSAVYIALTAVLLPINVLVKLLGTRLWKSQCRALEDDEANALCGIGSSEPLTPSANKRDYFGRHSAYGHAHDEEQSESSSPLDARASGRYPPVVTAPQTASKVLLLWNHIHDLFNANGNDRPSYVVSAQARGSHLSAKVVTEAVVSAPKAVTRTAAEKSKNLTFAVKLANGREEKDTPGMQEMEGALPISTMAFRESIDQAQDESRKRKAKQYRQKSLRRSRSIRSTRSNRSEEAPFLSGIDAIANHAPVLSQDMQDDSDYEDGEASRATTLYRRTTRDRREPRSSSYSTTLVKRRPTVEDGDQSYLSTPQEMDESFLNANQGNSIWREEDHEIQGGIAEEERDIDDEEDDEDEEEEEEDALIKPHAKIRWDDTPNNSARYNNPFYSVELDPFLWLPRDPTKLLDLCDTVEWHGAALVSSQGGVGKVGEWDDEEDIDEGNDVDEYDDQGSDAAHGSLHGDETINVIGPLAQRLQEADDLEDSVDPAASISRDQMEHYRKVLDRDEREKDFERGHRRISMKSASSTSHRLSVGSDTQMLKVKAGQTRHGSHDANGAIQEQSENEESLVAIDAEYRPAAGEAELNESPLPISGGMVPPGSADITATPRRKAEGSSQDPTTSKGGNSADAAGHDPNTYHKRRISMRKALHAEVLEEEYRRTIKSKLLEKKRREKSEHHAEGAVKSRPSTARDNNDMEMHDLEAQTGAIEEGMDSAIMTRHEQRMHRQQAAESVSRHDGSMTHSARAAMSSAFMPRRSDPNNKDTLQHNN